MEKIKKFYHVLMKIEECIFCVILLAMAGVVTLQVFFRYVLGDPLTWTEELSRFLFVWLIAFAAGYSVSTREHIKVELIVDLLPKKVQKILDVIMSILPLGVFVYLIPTCVQFMIQQNRLVEAEELLDGIPTKNRDGEWYFLKGSVFFQRGWLDDAMSHFSNACRMNPNNPEYRAALNRMMWQQQGNMGSPNGAYRTSDVSNMNAACNCCNQLICADCCCECMGGDLISCC